MMIDIEKLKALEKAATPKGCGWRRGIGSEFKIVLDDSLFHIFTAHRSTADADFVIAVRNALPEMIALLEEARELLPALLEMSALPAPKMEARVAAFQAKFDTKREG